MAESVSFPLKAEWIYHVDFATREQARLAIFGDVQGLDDPSRMNSTLDRRSPNGHERLTASA